MKFCFVINFYKDQPLALRLAKQVNDLYPDAAVALLGDGDRASDELQNELSVSALILDFPRKKHEWSGVWSDRYLAMGMSSRADYIIKLDPDTCLWRRFEIPEGADWFGTLSNDGKFVRGGACGFSSKAATELIISGLLRESSPHRYDRYGKFRWPHEEPEEPISCQDRIVGDAMRRLGYKPTNWPDAFILGNDMKVPEIEQFALTHPHPGCINPGPRLN